MRRTITTALVVALIALMVPLVAAGDTLSVPLGDFAYIAGEIREHTVGRPVAKLAVPARVMRSRIDFVKLELPAFLDNTVKKPVTVEVYDCMTGWERGRVSWTTPWREPGGDLDSICQARFTCLPGDDHPVVLDITETVRSWQKGRGQHGLFLKRPDKEGGGFKTEGLRLHEALSSARVKFYFTQMQE